MALSAPLPLDLDALSNIFGMPSPRAAVLRPDQVPEPYRSLLAHEGHMTVTLERFHDTEVSLRVVDTARSGEVYGRKILLAHAETGEVLQYGIMRIDLRCCREQVREQILAEKAPLGRILIENDLLRSISTHDLLRIDPPADIRSHFRLATQDRRSVYGRTATIFCDGEPAIGLLEVLPPIDEGAGVPDPTAS